MTPEAKSIKEKKSINWTSLQLLCFKQYHQESEKTIYKIKVLYSDYINNAYNNLGQRM